MTQIEISRHFKEDRLDRYAYIATTIGIGEIIYTYKQEKCKYYNSQPANVNITSTGIAIVTSPKGKLITMYVLTIVEARKYYNGKVPFLLAGIIQENMLRKHHIKQNQVHY